MVDWELVYIENRKYKLNYLKIGGFNIKRRKNIIILFVTMLIVISLPLNSLGITTLEINGKESPNESVLAVAETIPVEVEQMIKDGNFQDQVLKTYNVESIENIDIDKNTKDDLLELGVPVQEINKVEIKEDVENYTGEIYTKYIVDDLHYVCIDEDKSVLCIRNEDAEDILPDWDSEWDTTIDEYLQTGKATLAMLGMDSTYKLVNSEEESNDYWFLAYRKVEDNGLINGNNGVNITVARADNSVVYLDVFDLEANTIEAEVSDDEALDNAKSVLDSLEYNEQDVDSVELTYVQPNFFWENDTYIPAECSRLAYRISLDSGSYFVDVDAVTGEVIGGDATLGSGGSFGDQYVERATHRVNLAKNNFTSPLGYSPVYYKCASTNDTKASITTYLQRSDAMAFYFSGHGWIKSSRAEIHVLDADGKIV